MLEKILAIAGPTASGKTDASIKLAERFDGEIIGVDSRQIYRSIPIGTAQPSKDQLETIPHHLIAVKELGETISAGEYAKLVDEKIQLVLNKNKTPILCGGTGLYFKTLFEGIFSGSETNLDIRNRLDKEYDNNKEELYSKLQLIDPDYALKVHINNKKRLIRALELYELTGKSMTENFSLNNKKSEFYNKFFTIYLKMSRKTLHERILKRTIFMVENGLIEEVKNVLDNNYNIEHLDYIGFDEIISYLSNKISLDEAVEKIVIRTRQYAKRQLKWFDIQDFDLIINADNTNSNDIVDKVAQIY
ncbi:MAG: tRNA (adenosine(37)-N6)-dimethylallyltransferase MiaA [Candidatus Neomarinimicrobiota bacterium]|nr:tRNA (adenosine(37)-N6)-dimethylallyltransferase MiaA [Candidatus Neomarinimicrobiota bacterium]